MKTLLTTTFLATLLATGSALAGSPARGDLCWQNTDAFGSGRWTRCHGSGVQVTPPVRTITFQPPRRGHDVPPVQIIDPRERNGADIGGGSGGGGGGGGNGR